MGSTRSMVLLSWLTSFDDSSSNDHTITTTGNAYNQRPQHHTVTANGEAHLIGPVTLGIECLGTFDGTTSDYLSIPASSDFNSGDGDWTVEGWTNVMSLGNMIRVVSAFLCLAYMMQPGKCLVVLLPCNYISCEFEKRF